MIQDIEPTIRFGVNSLESYTLSGQALLNADSLADLDELIVGGRHLLVVDTKASRPFLVCDRETRGLVSSGGALGEGPGEITSVIGVDFKPGSDTGWFLDFGSRSLNYVDIDSLIISKALPDMRLILEAPATLLSAVWLGDSSIAATGFLNDRKLASFSSDGSFSHFFGPEPPGLVDVPGRWRNQKYRSQLRTNSDGAMIAAASRYTDRIEIHEGNELRQLIRGPGFHEPKTTMHYYAEGMTMSFDDDNQHGYVGLTVTDQLIFAMYSGKKWSESGNGFNVGQYIVVFTWEGQPIGVLRVDGNPNPIAISADGRDLYTLTTTPVPLILPYTVPELM